MVFQSIRLSQWADPEETADTSIVQQQMQSCPQLDRQFCESLQWPADPHRFRRGDGDG